MDANSSFLFTVRKLVSNFFEYILDPEMVIPLDEC